MPHYYHLLEDLFTYLPLLDSCSAQAALLLKILWHEGYLSDSFLQKNVASLEERGLLEKLIHEPLQNLQKLECSKELSRRIESYFYRMTGLPVSSNSGIYSKIS